ncbi:MAG: tetratricopeptide repeat protein [candidate division NC10 bacterium]|nr:tetratricopeptide repeat protein [candidate division NC10 bacterium]
MGRRTGGVGRRGVLAAAFLLVTVPVAGAQTPKAVPATPAKPPPAKPAPARPAPRDAAEKAQAHYELGVLYHERLFEHLDKAIEEYQAALKLKPDLAEAHYHLGLAYHTKAKLTTEDKALYRKALEEYRLYLRYSPNGELAKSAQNNIKAVEPRLR